MPWKCASVVEWAPHPKQDEQGCGDKDQWNGNGSDSSEVRASGAIVWAAVAQHRLAAEVACPEALGGGQQPDVEPLPGNEDREKEHGTREEV